MRVISDLSPVIQQYPLLATGKIHLEPLVNSGGLSGSRLWRVIKGDITAYCLRQWPAEHPSLERLRFIHKTLLFVAPRLPIVACPLSTYGGSTFASHASYLWELTPWLPGQADDQMPSRPERIRAAMQALAQFHMRAVELESVRGPAPAIGDRLRLFETARGGRLLAIQRAMETPLNGQIDRMCQELLTLASGLLGRQELHEALASVPMLVLIPAIRDIHREHVLFNGDEVTGLIDFGALRIDTPLTDISRLLGSLAGDDSKARQHGLAAYADIRPLASEERQVVHILDQTGQVGAALNWLQWLYLERRDMGPVQVIALRLEQVVGRLRFLANSH